MPKTTTKGDNWRGTHVPECPCPLCGHLLDGAGSPDGHAPSPGDCSVCISCASVLVFCDDMSLRAITAPEWAALPFPQRQELERYQRYVRQLDRTGEDSERRVWIAQCLCNSERRHCILAAIREADNRQEAERTVLKPLKKRVRKFLNRGTINPRCGICKADMAEWTFELGRTRYKTMAEAEEPLREQEAANALAAILFGDVKPQPPNGESS